MITVIGCDGGALPPAASDALASAASVAGASRHLQAQPVPDGARRVTFGALEPALDELLACPGPSVVLAAGDPGFFGIVRALRARGQAPAVIPAVSSVALAFARLGLPWDDALVVSAHGRHPDAARAAALAHPKVAILTAPDAGPERFVDELLAAGRDVHVAECLGMPDERVARVEDTPHGSFAQPNVVLAVEPRQAVREAPGWLAGHAGAPDGWALPENAFAHRDSMVTKPEVRALALARLAPRPGTVVWDIGAGSGSVAVECARFGAHAVAFERDPQQCARIRENAAAHDARVRVVEGTFPGSLEATPAPDALFLGGGGVDVLATALDASASPQPSRVVTALAALDRVKPVRDLLTGSGFATDGVTLQASRLAELPDDALRLQATNPVFVLWGERQ